MKKKIFSIFLFLLIISLTNGCGKKGDLEQPGKEKNYPKEYPNE